MKIDARGGSDIGPYIEPYRSGCGGIAEGGAAAVRGWDDEDVFERAPAAVQGGEVAGVAGSPRPRAWAVAILDGVYGAGVASIGAGHAPAVLHRLRGKAGRALRDARGLPDELHALCRVIDRLGALSAAIAAGAGTLLLG